jgi:CheY-like chemotaxis protein
VVVEIEPMLRRLIREDVELRTVLTPAIGWVKADPGQLGQVILNLALNARDAMPRGGRITLESANVTLGEEYGRTHASVPPGAYTLLAVSDTGEGMDDKTMARVFEPFFTTKEQGKGTGLGLSTVYGIVKQSGGFIWVYSEPGHGTTFKVYLPQVEQPAAAGVEDSPPAPPQALRGSETILVVEDDEALRTLIAEVLEEGGYRVLSAREGTQALSLADALDGHIHLVLTDIVMPRMGGREVVERLRAGRPGIRSVYMSGYTGNTAIHDGHLASGQPFLQKPFSSVELLRRIREQLAAAP